MRCHSWSADAFTTTQGKANSRDDDPKCLPDGQEKLPSPLQRHLAWEQRPKTNTITRDSPPGLADSFFQVFVQTAAFPRSSAWRNSPPLHSMNLWPSWSTEILARDLVFHHCVHAQRLFPSRA